MDLETFGGGKLTRLIRSGIQEILDNISNDETPATAKRTLTLKITFRPEKDRKKLKVQIESKINKAPVRTVQTNMFVGQDTAGNPVFYPAQEQIPGQLSVENVEGG